MALYDSVSLSNRLETGVSEMVAYKAAVNEAASELINLIRPSVPSWLQRDTRVAFAEEVFLRAATSVREEL